MSKKMLARLLERHHFDPNLIERLGQLNIKSLRQLLVRPECDVAADLDLSVPEYREMIKRLCHWGCPQRVTAYELWTDRHAVLPTRLPSLDTVLGGGLGIGSLTEVRTNTHEWSQRRKHHHSLAGGRSGRHRQISILRLDERFGRSKRSACDIL